MPRVQKPIAGRGPARAEGRAVARGVLAWAFLLGLAMGTVARANDPLPGVPGGSDLCPGIEQNYVLCSGNLGSASCNNLVDDVTRLVDLYRGEIDAHPDWRESLHASIWWGCGDAHLTELRSLLTKLDSPATKALLKNPPFSQLDDTPGPSDLAPPPPRSIQGTMEQCPALPLPPPQSPCANQILRRVRAEHETHLTECREKISGFLREQLDASETAWQRNTEIECGAEGASLPTASQRGLVHARCWARDTAERTRSMLAAHPECTEGAFDR